MNKKSWQTEILWYRNWPLFNIMNYKTYSSWKCLPRMRENYLYPFDIEFEVLHSSAHWYILHPSIIASSAWLVRHWNDIPWNEFRFLRKYLQMIRLIYFSIQNDWNNLSFIFLSFFSGSSFMSLNTYRHQTKCITISLSLYI